MVTTLSVDFSKACQLQYQDGCPDFAEKNYTITVTDATLIHTCDKVEVYKGVARIVPNHIDDSLSQAPSLPTEQMVALKFVWDAPESNAAKILKHESDLYATALKQLQGIYIPKAFGFFHGEFAGSPTTCFVTEYIGEPVENVVELPMAAKKAILNALLNIHKAGIRHGDVVDENIVFNANHQPFFIDFERAKTHDCPVDEVHEGVQAPSEYDFGCDELYEYTLNSGIWREAAVEFFGHFLLEDYIHTVDDLLQYAQRENMYQHVCRAQVQQGAEEVIRVLNVYRGNNGVRPPEYEKWFGVEWKEELDREAREENFRKIMDRVPEDQHALRDAFIASLAEARLSRTLADLHT